MFKKIIIVLSVIIFLIGVMILLKSKFQSQDKEDLEEFTPSPTVVLPTISENIIVELIPAFNKQSVALKIRGLTPDIESIEYELTYTTGAGLPRGVLGKISLQGEKEITRNDIVLGTCSSGKCVYDAGVTKVDLSLKFNTNKGSSIYQKSYTL